MLITSAHIQVVSRSTHVPFVATVVIELSLSTKTPGIWRSDVYILCSLFEQLVRPVQLLGNAPRLATGTSESFGIQNIHMDVFACMITK